VTVAIQEEQLGTGDATKTGLKAFATVDDDTVVVLYGDMPLLSSDLLRRLAERSDSAAARLITAEFDDPTGYGRIIRDESDAIIRVVEERDCTPDERRITEINAGAYAFRAADLVAALGQVSNQNAQGEYYLTDVARVLAEQGKRIEPMRTSPEEVVGINSQDQLAEAQLLLRRRINQRLMESGVWILDPDRTYIDDTVSVGPGARIYPGVHLEGATTVGAGARIGPDVFAVDSIIGSGTTVWYAVLREAVVGDGCEVGPYASLRPGTRMADGARVGTFVETKNTTLGEGTKALHLAYLGDATVGERTNVGAGTITVNYDGVTKHRTEIGSEAFIGSDTMLVAPVRIGDRATTGAGSVITDDVSEGALALERNEQREIPGYADRREARRAAREESEG
jgi:bifunctional UDP-N-acetylglucosamine pyrophosphorylase / glucosamine-1-phosphate N-acetyltransferase